MDVEEEPSIAYLSLIPGELFDDLGQANDRFCVKISDRLYSHQTSVRSLTRRLSEQHTRAQDNKFHNTFAKFLGIDQVLVGRIMLTKVQMPVKSLCRSHLLPPRSPNFFHRELSPLPAIAPPTVEVHTVEPPTAEPLTVDVEDYDYF